MARPRKSAPETVLKAIQTAFWKNGFHGTSMQDLEAVSGLGKQSLYPSFGNKEAMYAKALALYGEDDVSNMFDAMSKGDTAHKRFEILFRDALAPLKDGDRSGCFMCNASLDHAHQNQDTSTAVMAGIETTISVFSDALAVSAPYNTDLDLREKQARVIAVAYFGLRVLVRSGLSFEDVDQAAKAVLETI